MMGEPKMPTPEEMAKINKEREEYAKGAKETTSKLNSTWENVTGKGMTAEAVMAADASIENDLRKNSFIKDGLFVAGDQDRDLLKKFNETNLLANFKENFTLKPELPDLPGNRSMYDVTLEGKIDGQVIRLSAKDVVVRSESPQDKDGRMEDAIHAAVGGNCEKMTGEIDGKEISEDVVREMWRRYYAIGAIRAKAFQKTKKELKENRE